MNTSNTFRPLLVLLMLTAPLFCHGAEEIPKAPLSKREQIIKALGLTEYVAPSFPGTLQFEGVTEGYASLVIGRTAAGEPTDILVVEASHSQLAAASVEAIRGWRFVPVEGGMTPAARAVRLAFKIDGVVLVSPSTRVLEDERKAEVTKAVLQQQPITVPALQDLAQPPRALNQPMPAYPVALSKQKTKGTAAVRFFVDDEGKVRLPEVIEATAPEFGAAAIAAVSQWRYEPPLEGGRRVVASDKWAFEFKANN